MTLPILWVVLMVVAAAVVSGAVCFYLGGQHRRHTAEAAIGSAEEEAKRIVNDAIKTAEQKRKEATVEAKDEAFRLKSEADREIKDRRAEVSRQERRMDQKEEALDKRTAAMERKEEDLKKRTELVEARLGELEGQPALILEDETDAGTVVTYIYADSEALWELTVSPWTEPTRQLGDRILEVRDFTMRDVGDGFLEFSASDSTGSTVRFLTRLRSEEG